MNIIQSLGLKDKDQKKPGNKPAAQNHNKDNQHASGGCCGSCGGQKQEQGHK